jgi:hypothetical protein
MREELREALLAVLGEEGWRDGFDKDIGEVRRRQTGHGLTAFWMRFMGIGECRIAMHGP